VTIIDDRTADTLGLLHAVDGQPYDYGGAGSAGRSYDCSGIDCAVVRCMLGDNPPQGFHDFSTESWRLAEPAGVGPYGMRPGLGPQGTAVQLVFHHGGGGPDSHTEGFLWGKRFGSNGSHGVFYDDPSRETRIGYFDATPWYLPNELIGSHGNPDLSGRGGAAPSPAPTGGTVSTNPNAVLFGVDISNHQQNIDLDQIAREGFTAIIAKASEGSDYVDPFFGRNRDGAARNGLLFWGYHYLRAGDPVGNAQCWDRAVGGDRSIACMIDWEDGGGNLGDALAFKREVEALGYRVPMTYTGKWYWQRIDSPGGIDQLGALMDSCYGGNPGGFASGIYDGDGCNNWRSYGGADATILQFTDHAQVAGQTVDAWAYRGTRDQLAALLGGTTPPQGVDVTPDECRQAIRDVLNEQAPSRVPGSTVSVGLGDCIRNADAATYVALHAVTDPITSGVAGSTVQMSPQDVWRNAEANSYLAAVQQGPALLAAVQALADKYTAVGPAPVPATDVAGALRDVLATLTLTAKVA